MEKDLLLEKANKILIEKRLEQRKQFHKSKRDKRIVEAGLCPCCGEILNISQDDSYITNFLKQNNLNTIYDYYNSLKVCSKDVTHFIKTKGTNWDYDD